VKAVEIRRRMQLLVYLGNVRRYLKLKGVALYRKKLEKTVNHINTWKKYIFSYKNTL
jgi:hypothetical protein